MIRREFIQVAAGSLAAAALGSACGPAGPDPGDPRLSARPGTPTGTPTTGVATALGLGGSRDGILYVPNGYTGTVSVPLFVALHGAGGAGTDWGSYYARADARGMVLLAPDSRGSTWDFAATGTFGPDVAFLDRALALVFERCRVDATRVALAGFSDGASYALCLGPSNGDLFTNLVAYSPGFIERVEPIVGRPRVFVSHGTADAVLPFATTRDHIVPTLEDAGYDVTFQEFDGGHQVPAAVSEAALDWFLPASAGPPPEKPSAVLSPAAGYSRNCSPTIMISENLGCATALSASA
jgi:phospholipase/carboxylesterase